LLNRLIQHDLYKTQPIREKECSEKHTTIRRELGIISNESGISSTFSEIDELSDQCRYKDCTHTVEAGCAVLEALERGEISG